MIFDYNKVMYVYKKYEKKLALFFNFATIDLHKAKPTIIITMAR